jgi:hypothetical protein
MNRLRWTGVAAGLAGLAVVAGIAGNRAARPALASADDPSLERAREHVKMLDALYKNAVVAITDIYKQGAPAIKVAQRTFAAMKQDGWHDARLVDATGAPLNEANLPASEFEKRAVEQIKAGKAYYEEVVEVDGRRHLLAATVVPAVHERCATCHGVEKGDLLGFLRYDVPVR